MDIRYEGGSIDVHMFDGMKIIWDDDSGSDLCYTATEEGAQKVFVLLKLGYEYYVNLKKLGAAKADVIKIIENNISG